MAPLHVPHDLPSELLSGVTRDLVCLYLPVLARPCKELPKTFSRLQDGQRCEQVGRAEIDVINKNTSKEIHDLVVQLDIDVTDLATGMFMVLDDMPFL